MSIYLKFCENVMKEGVKDVEEKDEGDFLTMQVLKFL